MSKFCLFFKTRILGMRWLNELIGSILTSIGLNIDEKIGGMLHFFIYDSIKIFILLSVLIYIISYIQSYFPPEKNKKDIRKILWYLGKYIRSFTWNSYTVL